LSAEDEEDLCFLVVGCKSARARRLERARLELLLKTLAHRLEVDPQRR
jgi:hypothetical protein